MALWRSTSASFAPLSFAVSQADLPQAMLKRYSLRLSSIPNGAMACLVASKYQRSVHGHVWGLSRRLRRTDVNVDGVSHHGRTWIRYSVRGCGVLVAKVLQSGNRMEVAVHAVARANHGVGAYFTCAYRVRSGAGSTLRSCFFLSVGWRGRPRAGQRCARTASRFQAIR